MNNNFKHIEKKHSKLISKAIDYMNQITDKEHDINHMYDVVNYTKKLLLKIDKNVNIEACIIGAYFHDVGRTKVFKGHEELSANMLEELMLLMNYDEDFIKICKESIRYHKWNMTPKTLEGLIVKDADKLAWLGTGRWNSCLKNKQRLDALIGLLPELRNEILYFDYSKKIYDEEIVKITRLLYKEIYGAES